MTMPLQSQERERASQSFFDGWAGSYDERRISPWFRYTQHLTIDHLDLKPDSQVLDVGCGTGYATLTLATMLTSGRACGIDISAEMIRKAQAKVTSDLAGRVEFQLASSSALPYRNETFTHLLCTNSFHHYPEPIDALREMQRVLRRGGQLVILENAPDRSLYTWAWDKVLRVVERGHVRYYPTRELGGMIEQAGYHEVHLRLLRNEFLKHGKLFASIQLWSARRATAERGGATGP